MLRETDEPCYCLAAPFTQKRVVTAVKRFDCFHLPPEGYMPWW